MILQNVRNYITTLPPPSFESTIQVTVLKSLTHKKIFFFILSVTVWKIPFERLNA